MVSLWHRQEPARPNGQLCMLGQVSDWLPAAGRKPSKTPAAAVVALGAVTNDGVARDLLLVAAPTKLLVWDLSQVLAQDQRVAHGGVCEVCSA